MKQYSQHNFFKHTFCEFTKVNSNFFDENQIHFKSKSGSSYFYTEAGVYRYSNHWGRVANCRWRLVSDEQLKSQNYYVGFANWTDFYTLNEKEKQFYITVNFDTKQVNFHHQKSNEKVFVFFAETAQKRVKQIKQLLTEEKWSRYFETDLVSLRKSIVEQYINSNKTLQEIKREFH